MKTMEIKWKQEFIWNKDDETTSVDKLYIIIHREDLNEGKNAVNPWWMYTYAVQLPDTHVLYPGVEGKQDYWLTANEAKKDALRRIQSNERTSIYLTTPLAIM